MTSSNPTMTFYKQLTTRLPKPPYDPISDGSKATKMTTQPQKISWMKLLQITMLIRYATWCTSTLTTKSPVSWVDAIPQCRHPVPRLTCHKETRPPCNHSCYCHHSTRHHHQRFQETRPHNRCWMDWRHFRIGGLASKWLIIKSPSTGPTAPNLKVCPRMDPNHALLSPNQQQDWPAMLRVWPPQRKYMAHANIP
jgi:hypothetical protein